MNTSYNPQATADQARKTYRNVTAQLGLLGLDTSIPEGVRSVAEKTVAQSRDVYFDASIATFERSFDAAGQGAIAFNRKNRRDCPTEPEFRLRSGSEPGTRQGSAEVVELQSAYWQKQFSALTAQADEVRALSTKVTAAAAEPIKAHMTNGISELRQAH